MSLDEAWSRLADALSTWPTTAGRQTMPTDQTLMRVLA